MYYNKTILNWKWWLVLPFAVVMLAILSVPSIIIFALEKLITFLRVFDVGRKPSKSVNRLVDWVNK